MVAQYEIAVRLQVDESTISKDVCYLKAAALATKDDKNGLACERLLPDTPENAYTKCLSEALFNDDNIAALKCTKLLPQSTQQTP